MGMFYQIVYLPLFANSICFLVLLILLPMELSILATEGGFSFLSYEFIRHIISYLLLVLQIVLGRLVYIIVLGSHLIELAKLHLETFLAALELMILYHLCI